jgi:hypothetical protein
MMDGLPSLIAYLGSLTLTVAVMNRLDAVDLEARLATFILALPGAMLLDNARRKLTQQAR